MKKFKTLRNAVVGGLLLLAAGPLRPAFAADATFLEKESVVTVSTSMVTGATKLLDPVQSNGHVWLYAVPTSTGTVDTERVCIGDSTSISTNTASGNFRFPVGQLFELGNYSGSLYAIAEATVPIKVSVLRKR